MKDFENYNPGSINDYEDDDLYEEVEKKTAASQKKTANPKKEEESIVSYFKEDDDDELRRQDELNIDENEELANHFKGGNKRLSEENQKKYFDYISKHTGDTVKEKTPREKRENLSKAAAAYMMLKASSTKSYDIGTIRKNATKLKQTLDIDNMRETDIDAMLTDPEELRKGVNSQLETLYGKEAGFEAYIKSMKTLADSMMSDEKRTSEYKNMVKCIKDISEAKPGDKDDIISKNYKLMESVEKYMKGKKRVRKTSAGVEHFDNALDALAIMLEHNPMLSDKVAVIVDRINEVRGSEAENHKDHVDINKYGAERAVEAKKKRIEKTREKKMERTLDKDKLKKKEMSRPTLGPM